ncbi:hypothetical protein LT85_0892 [Collimonas arenae]|uniref:Uncharacterized protein n=1 Tax=Collimonas arenae TaxID=279058 RepID=A0A0A1FB18_9BURK|nr:hypothetical protein LT85_0892 [Collimonas arenae]
MNLYVNILSHQKSKKELKLVNLSRKENELLQIKGSPLNQI